MLTTAWDRKDLKVSPSYSKTDTIGDLDEQLCGLSGN